METIFTKIYENNMWGNNNNSEYNGSSGEGSLVEYNKHSYVPFLKKFIKNNNIKSVVDLGCGDFRCGKAIYNDLNIEYNGYEAYHKVVEYNSKKFHKPKYTFNHLDIFDKKEDIKSADLCIIKDVMQHWNNENIYIFMDYIVNSRKFKYILICNCCNQIKDNDNIKNGEWRPLTCKLLPLKKYKPIKLFNYYTKEVSIIQTF